MSPRVDDLSSMFYVGGLSGLSQIIPNKLRIDSGRRYDQFVGIATPSDLASSRAGLKPKKLKKSLVSVMNPEVRHTNGANATLIKISTERETAFIEMIQSNRAILYWLAAMYTLVREDRDDLVQDMNYQLWKSYGSFANRSGGSSGRWRALLYLVLLDGLLFGIDQALVNLLGH